MATLGRAPYYFAPGGPDSTKPTFASSPSLRPRPRRRPSWRREAFPGAASAAGSPRPIADLPHLPRRGTKHPRARVRRVAALLSGTATIGRAGQLSPVDKHTGARGQLSPRFVPKGDKLPIEKGAVSTATPACNGQECGEHEK